jgi:hypothetical protein
MGAVSGWPRRRPQTRRSVPRKHALMYSQLMAMQNQGCSPVRLKIISANTVAQSGTPLPANSVNRAAAMGMSRMPYAIWGRAVVIGLHERR